MSRSFNVADQNLLCYLPFGRFMPFKVFVSSKKKKGKQMFLINFRRMTRVTAELFEKVVQLATFFFLEKKL